MTNELRHLLLALYEAGAVKFGAFRLKLHETNPDAPLSPIYLDLRVTRSFPWLLRNISALLGSKVIHLSPDFVADVPTAATPFASVIAASFNLPMLTPRADAKAHGSSQRIEGSGEPGRTVVLVDDIITAADSKISSINILRAAGLIVNDVVVFLDREQGGREELIKIGCDLHAILTLSELLDLFVDERRIQPHQRTAVTDYLARMLTSRSSM
jgi:uridine monophosphate synthetase